VNFQQGNLDPSPPDLTSYILHLQEKIYLSNPKPHLPFSGVGISIVASNKLNQNSSTKGKGKQGTNRFPQQKREEEKNMRFS